MFTRAFSISLSIDFRHAKKLKAYSQCMKSGFAFIEYPITSDHMNESQVLVIFLDTIEYEY